MLVRPDTFSPIMDRVAQAARSDGLIVDLETTGLRPYHGDRLFGIAVGIGEFENPETLYFPFRHEAGWNLEARQLVMLLNEIRKAHALGGHNFIRFDLPMLAIEAPEMEGLLRPGGPQLWDSIVDATLTNENEQSMSLDALGAKYLPGAAKGGETDRMIATLRAIPGLKKLRSKRSLWGHLAKLTPEQIADYACGDVRDCARLHARYLKNQAEWGIETLAQEHYQYARLLARIEAKGVAVDIPLVEQRIPQIEQQREGILSDLRRLYGSFNPQSPPQVARLCGTENAQRETLERSNHPAARGIIRYKQLGKLCGTYYEATLRDVDANGLLHPQMNLTKDQRDEGGTRGTRLSCSRPNLQNAPKRAATEPLLAAREYVIARPGNDLHPEDYERAEMWVGAHYSRDESLHEAYHAGRDLYQELADKVKATGSACTRHDGKIGWLGIQYGAGNWKIAQMFDWPFRPRSDFPGDHPDAPWAERQRGWDQYNEQPSVQFKKAFFELCPGIKTQMKARETEAEERRSLRLWTGKPLHFDDGASLSYKAWNRLVQGGVGEMVRIAMQRAESALEPLDAFMILQVHDEIVAEGPEENRRRIALTMKEVMEDFDNFWLRPRVDLQIGKDYHNVKEYTP